MSISHCAIINAVHLRSVSQLRFFLVVGERHCTTTAALEPHNNAIYSPCAYQIPQKHPFRDTTSLHHIVATCMPAAFRHKNPKSPICPAVRRHPSHQDVHTRRQDQARLLPVRSLIWAYGYAEHSRQDNFDQNIYIHIAINHLIWFQSIGYFDSM